MKYTLTFTHTKTENNKFSSQVMTTDDKGLGVSYVDILRASDPTIPVTWEDYDQFAWNPFVFTGVMTTEQAFANATMLNLSLEQYTNMLIAYHKKASLTAIATITFEIIAQ